jgi:hypothetical protein
MAQNGLSSLTEATQASRGSERPLVEKELLVGDGALGHANRQHNRVRAGNWWTRVSMVRANSFPISRRSHSLWDPLDHASGD